MCAWFRDAFHLMVKTMTIATPLSRWQSAGLVALGAFCFSTAIILTRFSHGLEAPAIVFYRMLFSFLFLSALLSRRRDEPYLPPTRRATLLLVFMGVCMALVAMMYIFSIQQINAGTAALLVNTTPIYMALLAPLLLKEPRPRYTLPSLLLAVPGVILLADPAHLQVDPGALGGVAAGLCAGVGFSLPLIIGRKLRGQVNMARQIWWGAGVAALVLSPMGLSALPQAIPNLPVLIPFGVLSFGLPYLLYFTGLKTLPAQVVSILALLEPVGGILIGLALGEPLTLPGVIGSALILGSIVVISR